VFWIVLARRRGDLSKTGNSIPSGVIYDDEDFAQLFEVRGRPAIAPWRLALVTVMQFAEGLSDRQAAEAVRARIDREYALAWIIHG
jgi:transposase